MKRIILAITYVFINIIKTISLEPVNLDEIKLNGEYIGKHIEYINEKELFIKIKDNWNTDDIFINKMLSGRLHSDRNIKINIDHTLTGYKASLYSKKTGKNTYVEWNTGDLINNEDSLSFIQSNKKIPALNFNPHAYWIKFQVLNNTSNNIEILIEQDKQFYSWFDLYYDDGNGFKVKKGAFEDPLSKREMKYKNIVFNISVKPGINTYYIRTDSFYYNTVPIRLWNMDNFVTYVSNDNAFQGIITGIFLLILIYCIILLILEKNTSYLYLIMVVLCCFILYLCSFGFGLLHIWPFNSFISLFLLYIIFPCSFIANLLFSRSFIEAGKSTPFIDKIILSVIFVSFILLLLIIILPGALKTNVFIFIMITEHLQFIPVIPAAIIVIKKKNYTGIFLLIGIILHILSQLEFLLSSMNIIPYSLINYINIRSFSFILLMTIGISYKVRKMRNSLYELKQKIFEINLKLKSGKKLTDETILKIESVKEYIKNNYSDLITRDKLAYAVGLSPDHLGRIFKQYTGEKISGYLNKIRINHAAARLKETEDKIIDIAFDTGFESLRTFNKVFLKITGRSPSQYRKEF